MNKILVLWDRIGDYHHARLLALANRLGKRNVIAADLGIGDSLYLWGNDFKRSYRHFYLSNKKVEQFDLFNRIKMFSSLLKDYKIQTVAIAGYGRVEYVFFIILAKIRKKRVILFAESWYPGNWLLDKAKSLFLNYFVDSFFVSGVRAEQHFNNRLRVPLSKIQKGYSVVDNEHFANLSLTEDPFNNSPYVLCVARYSKEKNLGMLIDAYQNSSLYRKWNLVLIGDGPQKEELIKLIGDDSEHIILTGWKSYDELPHWYHHAKAFVLPSVFEPWGLVVNEALAAGVPVISSVQCGCAPDLIPIKNQFNPMNELDLIKLLNRLFDDEYKLKFSIEEITEKLKVFSLENWGNTLAKMESNNV